ncbi:hypothetical protein [Tessaracoccus flavescens]|nr:hypothetical protein [Tessaracoccus flavescens]
MSLLLESELLVPSWVMGAIVLFILLSVLVWIIGMGSGRPHSK